MIEIFKFTAYNTEAQYGYGTEEQAIEYVELLNKDREVNLYEYELIEISEEEAEMRTDIFNL